MYGRDQLGFIFHGFCMKFLPHAIWDVPSFEPCPCRLRFFGITWGVVVTGLTRIRDEGYSNGQQLQDLEAKKYKAPESYAAWPSSCPQNRFFWLPQIGNVVSIPRISMRVFGPYSLKKYWMMSTSTGTWLITMWSQLKCKCKSTNSSIRISQLHQLPSGMFQNEPSKMTSFRRRQLGHPSPGPNIWQPRCRPLAVLHHPDISVVLRVRCQPQLGLQVDGSLGYRKTMQDLGFSIVLDTRVCLFSVAMHWLTSGNLLGVGQVWPGKTADCLHGNNSCKHVHGSQMDWSGLHFFVAKAACLRVIFIEHQVVYHGATKNRFGDEPRKRGSPYASSSICWRERYLANISEIQDTMDTMSKGAPGIPVQSVLPSSGHPGTYTIIINNI